MLGQKNEDFPDEGSLEAAWVVYDHESKIDDTETLYLLTWSPDPDELPHADFSLQHCFNVNTLADYLKCCENGLICVESTQMGNPHYHGWYQTSDDSNKERGRIIMAKVLQRFGNLKITKCKGHYRKHSYTKQGNALHYYKDDLFGQMQGMVHNPITKDSKDDTDWQSHMFFFCINKKGYKTTTADTEAKVTQREFYKQFYGKSID